MTINQRGMTKTWDLNTLSGFIVILTRTGPKIWGIAAQPTMKQTAKPMSEIDQWKPPRTSMKYIEPVGLKLPEGQHESSNTSITLHIICFLTVHEYASAKAPLLISLLSADAESKDVTTVRCRSSLENGVDASPLCSASCTEVGERHEEHADNL